MVTINKLSSMDTVSAGDQFVIYSSRNADARRASIDLVKGYITANATDLTVTSDALIHGLTIGRGRASVETNTALGIDALSANTTGTNNTAAGHDALSLNTTGYSNTAHGAAALENNVSGAFNTATGVNALQNNTTGTNNTASGRSALRANTTGTNNTAAGREALRDNTTGDSNTAFGREALSNNTTGSTNTACGATAGSTITTGSNLTCVGFDAEPSSATATNEITLGNASVATLRCNATTITSLSDERDKTGITALDCDQAAQFVADLNPACFIWDARDGSKIGQPAHGFIAQELQRIQAQHYEVPGLVHEANPERLEAAYGHLLPTIVAALQHALAEIEQLKTGGSNGND